MKMTIDEAMAQLQVQLEAKRDPKQEHQATAIKLGIESLKREKRRRALRYGKGITLLPGETEE